MGEKVKYFLGIQVAGGVHLEAKSTLEVDAYDKIQILLAAGESGKEVSIQPDAPGLARLIVIIAKNYADLNGNGVITYTVNEREGGEEAVRVTLDGPHLFIGSGAVSLLDAAPAKLFFTNSTEADVSVDILVGRSVAESPP